MNTNTRPILFNGEMVRAILDGRKTQTRRVMKPQPEGGLDFTPFAPFGVVNGKGNPLICRHGQPGDRLWVRENYRCYYGGGFENVDGDRREHFESFGLEFQAGQDMEFDFNFFNGLPTECTEAEHPRIDYEQIRRLSDSHHDGFRPSIHMPRWASRITLEIINVRVERLKDISRNDARAEGVAHQMVSSAALELDDLPEDSWVGGFRWLWQSINGPDSWEANPWVWVIEFKRIPQEATQ